MRTFIAVLLAAMAAECLACSCFSPEMRAKTARETLELARLAIFGKVIEVNTEGVAKVLVLESFKGPPKQAIVEVAPNQRLCPEARLAVSEEVLVLSFKETVTTCDKHPSEHFLLEAFRSNALQ